MPTLTEQVNSAVASLQTELTETQSLNGKLDEFINGGPTDTVTTTGGTFPCLNKIVADFLAKNYAGGEYAESTFYAGGKMVYYSNALYLATQDFTSSSTGTVANSLSADVTSGDLDFVANFQPAVDAAAASAAAALTSENNAATSETNAAASAASAAASAALLTPDDVTLESSGGNLKIKDSGVSFPKLDCAIDDDTMETASATTVPTSESVKAYVDKKMVVGIANSSSSATGGSDGSYRSGGVILNDGTLRCWGDGSYANLGVGDDHNDRSFPMQPAFPFGVTGNVVKWERSNQSNLVLMDNGHVYAWGRNNQGELGLGHTNFANSPTRITSLNSYNIVDICMATGYHATPHSMFLVSDGKLLTCGYNNWGQLGIGNTTAQSTPQLLSKTDWVKIYSSNTSASNSAGIDSSGDLYTWGLNDKGQLGIGNTTSANTPQHVNAFGGTSVSQFSLDTSENTSISATYGSAAALLSDGSIYTWGYNDAGQLGLGNNTQQNTPQHVSALGTDNEQVLVAAGPYGVIYVLKTNNGGVYSSGYNYYGQQADGTSTNRNTFALMNGSVRSGRTIVQLQATGGLSYSGLAILWDDGLIKVCGYNAHGNLGVGHTSSVTTLTEVLGFMREKPVELGAAGRFSEASLCARTKEGNFFQTGYSGESQRPSDDDERVSTFQPVQFL